jgi:hypothetical protein
VDALVKPLVPAGDGVQVVHELITAKFLKGTHELLGQVIPEGRIDRSGWVMRPHGNFPAPVHGRPEDDIREPADVFVVKRELKGGKRPSYFGCGPRVGVL